MKLSRRWLDEFVKIDAEDREYSEKMTMSGSKVEDFEVIGADVVNVVVGKVLEIERHPDSDHLWVCKIDVAADRDITIVTGAQNVQSGDIVPVALDGASLPGGVEIKTGALRGVTSEGMLCSLKELGLDSHDFPYADEDGIFILQNEQAAAPLGANILDALDIRDSVVDFEITNNRADCLSVIGLARESAVTFGRNLTLHSPEVLSLGQGNISDYLAVDIENTKLCPRYSARVVTDIKIEPSPAWMRRKLRVSGVRPINNIVDITNYVMLEYGQPMHAFDYSCVNDAKIVVRPAREGEKITTLDGVDHDLTTDMLLIADSENPIGIAGVMGGENSEITNKTTTIVLESATFNGTSIRKTSIALGMRTDASGRFEKGLDINGTIAAVNRACELIEMLNAGKVVPGIEDIMAESAEEKNPVKLDADRINALLGTNIDRGFMEKTLLSLGFEISGDDITAPSWRSDIEHIADIAEEVARFYGYDIIEQTLVRSSASPGGLSERQQFESDTAASIRGMGFFEIKTYSFTSPGVWDKIRLPDDSPLRNAFVIQNPLGEDTSVMRTTSLPSMLDILSLNLSHRNSEARLYEMATIYNKQPDNSLAHEEIILTLGAYGNGEDFFSLKGAVDSLLREFRLESIEYNTVKNNPSYHPGRCAEIVCGGKTVAVLGQIHPLVTKRYDMECNVFAAEINLAAVMAVRAPEKTFAPLPRFPAVTRDIAVVCDADVTAASLQNTIASAGGTLLESCNLFDVYTGSPIPSGKRSLAFALSFRSLEGTLTDEDSDSLVAAILRALEDAHGATIR